MTSKKVTIQDVARKAGVSITTVSRFLNQRFDAMSEDTKDRIQAVISELKYQPNLQAQALKGNKTKTIGVLVVNMGYPFCISIIRSISDILTMNDYGLLVGESGGDPAREHKLLQSLMAQNIDGLVIQTGGENNLLIEKIAQEIPVILVDRQFLIPGVENIVTNNRRASFDLVTRLYEEGYESVVFVTEPASGISTREGRLAGYQDACQAAGRAAQVIHVHKNDEHSLDIVLHQLNTAPPEAPFAVYTANGLLALSLFPLLQAHFHIPTQAGFVTFDEPDWSKLVQPQLTCIRQPTEQMGQVAAQTILQHLMQGEPLQSGGVRVLDSEVVWSSSAQLRAN